MRLLLGMTVLAPVAALAQSFTGNPVPYASCTNSRSYYWDQYSLPKSSDMHQVKLLGNNTTPFATLPSANDLSAAGGQPGTVAMGLGKDGALYAMGSSGDYTDRFKLIRYAGDQTSQIVDLTSAFAGIPINTNFNAADIDLSSARTDANGAVTYPGDLIVGHLWDGGPMEKLYRIGIPAGGIAYMLIETITLSQPIPGEISGDFAISPDGKTIYGISWARTGGRTVANPSPPPATVSLPPSIPWTVDLTRGATYGTLTRGNNQDYGASGTVVVASIPVTVTAGAPYGAAAWLPDGNLAFYFNGFSLLEGESPFKPEATPFVMVVSPNNFTSAGAYAAPAPIEKRFLSAGTASTDGASCQLPVVSVACSPARLPDSPGQSSTCTASARAPLLEPLTVNLTPPVPPVTGARYSTTCGNSITLPASPSSPPSVTCTITAVNETTPEGGGTVATATLALTTPPTLPANMVGVLYTLDPAHNSANVEIYDDDTPASGSTPTAVPMLGQWALAVLAMLLGLTGWRHRA